MPDTHPYRVFISYSHDNREHKLSVLELANKLRQDGIDAQIDRYALFPAAGWPRWMCEQIERAGTIIVVCSSAYRERFEGTDTSHRGLGAKSEGLIITQSLYEEMGSNQKRFIPVLFRGNHPEDVPLELRPFTRFWLPDQYDDLYRVLTDQPEVQRPALGQMRRLPVLSAGAAEDLAAEADLNPSSVDQRRQEEKHPYVRSNREAMQNLRAKWSDGRLSVVAGAGIGVAAGLPTWPEMLDRLIAGYVTRMYSPVLGENGSETLVQTLQDEFRHLSPIVSAQFIQSRFSKDDFVELLRRALYEGTGSLLQPPVLCCLIARLAKKLHSIVTFNFDDLLEQALAEAGIAFTSIAEANHLSNIRGLPVYHPHGYLPRNETKSARIVLAESQYHDQYFAQHSWTNIVVSRILMESTCLFIGTSLSDPNLRRLADAAHRENALQEHFLISHLPIVNDRIAQAAMVEIFEAAHQQMGISLLWVEDFAQVAALLEQICANDGNC